MTFEREDGLCKAFLVYLALGFDYADTPSFAISSFLSSLVSVFLPAGECRPAACAAPRSFFKVIISQRSRKALKQLVYGRGERVVTLLESGNG